MILNKNVISACHGTRHDIYTLVPISYRYKYIYIGTCDKCVWHFFIGFFVVGCCCLFYRGCYYIWRKFYWICSFSYITALFIIIKKMLRCYSVPYYMYIYSKIYLLATHFHYFTQTQRFCGYYESHYSQLFYIMFGIQHVGIFNQLYRKSVLSLSYTRTLYIILMKIYWAIIFAGDLKMT